MFPPGRSRREFLLTAAAAAQTIRAQPTEKVRVAVLGTQHSHVKGKLPALQNSASFDVVGICESDPAARARMEKDPIFNGVPRLSEDQLLNDKSIQLVVVECHVWDAIPLGKKVIAAGKHLHLEKPPTDKMAPFGQLVADAKRKNLLLQMGYIWRFHQGITAALEAARKGWLGEVFMLRAEISSDLDKETWADVGHYSGGMMFELAGHVIDRMVDLWGRPKAVKSWLRHDSNVADRMADNTLAVFEYDRALAVIASAGKMAGAAPHRTFELIGTDGTFSIQPIEPGTKARVMMREARGPYARGWQDVTMPPQPRYGKELEEMARAIRTRTPLQYSYDFELLLQETILRACQLA